MTKKEAWEYLNKELARLKVTADAYNKLFDSIEARGNSFNQAIQLILDGWSRSMSLGLSLFFDHRKDTWSLYRFSELDNKALDGIKEKAQEIIDLRMNKYAHLSKNINHADNFAILTDKGLKIVNSAILEIYQQLHLISQSNKYNAQYALDWIGMSSSIDLLVDYLSKEQTDDNTI